MVSTCQKLRLLPKKSAIMWPTPKVQEQLCRSTEERTPTASNWMSDSVWGGRAFLNPQIFTLLLFLLMSPPHV